MGATAHAEGSKGMGQEHCDYEGNVAPQGQTPLHVLLSPCPLLQAHPCLCQRHGTRRERTQHPITCVTCTCDANACALQVQPRPRQGWALPSCCLTASTLLAVLRRSRSSRNRLQVRLLSFNPWPRPRLSSCMRRRSRITSSWPVESESLHPRLYQAPATPHSTELPEAAGPRHPVQPAAPSSPASLGEDTPSCTAGAQGTVPSSPLWRLETPRA